MVKTPKLSPLQESEILALRLEGRTLRDIGILYNITAPTVAGACRRAEKSSPSAGKISLSDIDEMIKHAQKLIKESKKGSELKAGMQALEQMLTLRKKYEMVEEIPHGLDLDQL
jgi:hypothetical protein